MAGVAIRVAVVVSADSVVEAEGNALDFSGGTSLDGGGAGDLGSVSGDSKKGGGERFHLN